MKSITFFGKDYALAEMGLYTEYRSKDSFVYSERWTTLRIRH